MANEMLSVEAAIIASLYTAYLLYIRIRRQSILSKYKPGTAGYDSVNRLFSARKLIISIVVTLFFIANAIFTIRDTKYTDAHALFFILILTLIVSVITFFVIYLGIFGGFKKK